MKKLKKKYVKLLLCLIIILIVVYIVYKVYALIIQPTDVFIVKNGEIFEEEIQIGYVIRDEMLVKGENYKNGMLQIKSEKEKVAKDEAIFRYYNSNEENLTKKISELDLKIQEALANEKNIFSGDIKLLENQIKEKINNMDKHNDLQEISEYKKDIINYMTKKAKIAGDLSPAGSYVKELINQRVEVESKLNSGSEYVIAPKSGVISYRIDNLESVLTVNDFSNLSISLFEGLNLKTGQISATNNNVGKIVNNFYCYIAVILNSENSKQAEIGDKVTLRLSNQKEINAEISYITEESDNKRIILFKITEEVEYLIDFRKISVTVIWWKDSGLKIPNTAIINENELNYVVRNRSGYLQKILINVLRKNENYCIVDNFNTEELKELGYTYSEINDLKKLTLYDEILLNPSK